MLNFDDEAGMSMMFDEMEDEIKQKDAKIAELEAELKRLRDMPSFLTQSTFLNPPKDVKKSWLFWPLCYNNGMTTQDPKGIGVSATRKKNENL